MDILILIYRSQEVLAPDPPEESGTGMGGAEEGARGAQAD